MKLCIPKQSAKAQSTAASIDRQPTATHSSLTSFAWTVDQINRAT